VALSTDANPPVLPRAHEIFSRRTRGESFPQPVFSSQIAAPPENFPVKKIFGPIVMRPPKCIPRVKTFQPSARKFNPTISLSTQKVTENLQKRREFCLTVPEAIPISCGQGSGHPHPVVVDNVLGSFGKFVSPALFDRR
jgi:hypothetical protein